MAALNLSVAAHAERLPDTLVDLACPQAGVEVELTKEGVLWVNVDGVCVLRVSRTLGIRKTITVDGEVIYPKRR